MQYFFWLIFLIPLILAKQTFANCPVCILTVGGGLFLAKKLGIDDLLVSIWISGLNTAIAVWVASTLKKKILNNPVLWSLVFYSTTLLYLWYTKQIGHKGNTFLGLDKIMFGLTVGLLTFYTAVFIDKFIRSKNEGKVLFHYQKVIIPIILLLTMTFVFKILL